MGKRAKSDEIISKLREVEVRLASGETVAAAARVVGVTEQSHGRWRKGWADRQSRCASLRGGGLQVDQAKRMKKLVKENQRLRRPVSGVSLDNQILKEIAQGKFQALPANAMRPITWS